MSDAVLRGVAASPGMALGPVRRLAEPVPHPPEPAQAPGDPAGERDRALAALAGVAAELENRTSRARTPAARGILDAQTLMARDPGLLADVRVRTAAGRQAARAISEAFEKYRWAFAGGSEYLAARVVDLDDIRDRALAHLYGLAMPGIPVSDTPFVLVARDLAPADTVLLDPDSVLALVTEQGGPTSHTAILARAMGLPGVVAVPGVLDLDDGVTVLVDGGEGSVRVRPGAAEIARLRAAEAARTAALRDTATGPGRTSDGYPIPLLANVTGPADLDLALAHGAEGIGLLRTEFLFMDRTSAPSVQEQTAAYRRMLAAFPGGRVVVRVLDAGADKPLGFLPRQTVEPNPMLGERGLRLLTLHPEILADQLAALAAAAEGLPTRLEVMAPMVTDLADARAFAAACQAAGLERAGVMVEVPAAALRARDLAGEVAFFSLGTNDLAQYVCAADRRLGGLARLQDPWQPAVLDLAALTAAAARATGRGCGVCGEAAADPALACVLVGFGVTSLSMSAPALGTVRAALGAHSLAECRQAADAARAARTASEARTAALAVLPGLS